jgi:Uma2 family endonuclease
MTAITLNLNPIIQLTDEQFYQLCQENQDVKLERNTKGEIIAMHPSGRETSKRNSLLNLQRIWAS